MSTTIPIAGIDREVSRLCLGGNVFGWTATQAESFALLDAYVDSGGNFIDTADCYSEWVDGHDGFESERILGAWIARRRRSDDLVIATKVGGADAAPGLSAPNIRAGIEGSLRRLGVDRVDLYYAHVDDRTVDLAETLGAFAQLVDAGMIAAYAASNYDAGRLLDAQRISSGHGWPTFAAVQTHYNLVHRHEYEDDLAQLCLREGIPCVAYSALADGFLTGKYRWDGPPTTSARRDDVAAYLTKEHADVLDVLREIAGARRVSMAAIALAWLTSHPAVIALASARTVEQLRDITPALRFELTDIERAALDGATDALADVPVPA